MVRFRILGPLEVASEDRVLPTGGAKQRALLAILLLSANEVVAADRLVEDLWGARPPESGRTALQVRVSQLRKALGPAGTLIVTRDPGYVLRLEREQLDLHVFERLVGEADAAEPAIAVAKLREALSLWRGPPLADLYYESFAQPAIARLEELRLAAIEKRIDSDLALGRHAALVAELEALVGQHPLRELLRAQLMLALYRSGRQADALDAYRSARMALVDQLGIEPGKPLRELEQAILRHDPALELSPAAGPERSVLAVALLADALEPLLTVGASLARQPGRELIMARLVDQQDQLAAESAALHARRELLLAEGIVTRAAAFISSNPGDDAARIAAELDCDLMIVDAPRELLESPVLRAILASAPCDVAALLGGQPVPGPLLVPFVGAEHDWTAIELGALARRSVAGSAAPGRTGRGRWA